ncbi:MAG: glycoside hydrolase family 32 protein [Candidatus Brocadiia bacterium]
MTENDHAEAPETSIIHPPELSDSLAEQKRELEELPLMHRFAESRRKMADDPYRPHYHFVSPESTMNDPNGLCFWQGRWHLFYQGYPPEDPRQHWGHAVSDDLVHWQDLPYAIAPGPEDRCFSGSTFVEEDRVIAMYHGTRAGNMVAVAHDPLLLNWTKLTGGPVIPMAAGDTEEDRRSAPDGTPLPYRVHDPCIWRQEGRYYALSNGTKPGVGDKEYRADFLFRSDDLVNWEYLHPFVEADRFTLAGDDGACPYFWPIGNRHILLFFSHMSGGQYLLGDYDTQHEKFMATAHGKFNFGPSTPSGVHAPSATPENDDVIVIFNMNPGKPTEGWNQIMTLPRRLRLVGKEQLRIEPAGDIASLRTNHRQIDAMPLPANKEVVLDEIEGKSMEIKAELEHNGVPALEFNVLRSPDRGEYTRIVFYHKRGMRHSGRFDPPARHYSLITIDSARSSLHPDVTPRGPETAEVLVDDDEPLQLRVFVDRSVVEAFVNDRQCLAVRVYPEREDSAGVSLRAQGRDARLLSLNVWDMNTIYEHENQRGP